MSPRSSPVCDNPPTGPDNGPPGTGGFALVDQGQIIDARRALGRRLADFRQAAGYGQEAFAPLVLYSRSSLANVEVGRQKGTRTFWQQCDKVLQTGSVLATAFTDIEALERQ